MILMQTSDDLIMYQTAQNSSQKSYKQKKLQCKCKLTEVYILKRYKLINAEVMVLDGLLVQEDVYETSDTTKKNSAQRSAILWLVSRKSILHLHPVSCYGTPSTQHRRRHFPLYSIKLLCLKVVSKC